MKDIKSLFYKLTNIKAIKCYKIKSGITNNNYKIITENEKYVIRIPRKDMIGLNRENEEKVINKVLMADLNVDVVYFNINSGIMISRFIQTKKRKQVPFGVIIEHLKKLHSLSTNNIIEFNPFKLIDMYADEISEKSFNNKEIVIQKAKEVYKRYQVVLCHNDVLYANCINSNNKEYLIDYEYAGKNIDLFDIASFLSENNIDDINKQQRFIKMYYGEINDQLIDDINVMFLLLDMLWAYWGYYMYEKYQEQVFLDIATSKHNRYNSKDYIY